MSKIRDLIKNKNDAATYMVDEITHVIKTFGKRPPGSEGEKNAVEYMAEQVKPMTSFSKVESFKLHPGAFYGWIYLTVTIMLTAFVVSFFIPLLSLLLIFLGVYIMIKEFVMYDECVDFLFKEKTSHNMYCLRKAKIETKRRIFFNGHPDAAWQWSFNRFFGGEGFVAHFLISCTGIVYFTATTLAALITNLVITKSAQGLITTSGPLNPFAKIFLMLTLIFIPPWIFMYWLWDERVVVDGANDNLTGCFIGIAVLKFMQDNNIELDYTDVGVLISGSEEAGLRGAYAFAKKHKGEFDDVPTLFVVFDTMHEEKYLFVNTSDRNGTVKSDPYASALFYQACINVGSKPHEGSVPLGSTDNAALSRFGYRSTGITALNHNLQDYYHTPKDSYYNLDNDCLATCFAASVEAVALLDEGWNAELLEKGRDVKYKKLKQIIK